MRGVNMRRLILFLIASTYASSINLVIAQEAQSWSSPSLLEMPIYDHHYPRGAARRGAEGWVIFRFMVGVDGRVSDPAILHASGREVFQQEALRALQRSTWEPARLAGEAIEASASFQFRFSMEETQRAVHFSFQRRYDNLMEYLEANDQEAATDMLNELNARDSFNHMEDALLNMARYSYHQQYGGSDIELMGYLDRALAYESSDIENARESVYLPDKLIELARNNLFMLQVNTRHYAEALNTYYLSRQSGINVEAFTPVVEQIRRVRGDESSYAVAATTDSNGLWSMLLHKAGLTIHSLGNSVSEIKLWCRRRHQVFEFQEGAEYAIPESWGQCTVQVSGAPNVQFQVEQFKPE